MPPRAKEFFQARSHRLAVSLLSFRADLFVGQGAAEAEGRMGARCVALHQALSNHKITHEHYVGGHGGHDWATWRHLLYYRFLPNLRRENQH